MIKENSSFLSPPPCRSGSQWSLGSSRSLPVFLTMRSCLGKGEGISFFSSTFDRRQGGTSFPFKNDVVQLLFSRHQTNLNPTIWSYSPQFMITYFSQLSWWASEYLISVGGAYTAVRYKNKLWKAPSPFFESKTWGVTQKKRKNFKADISLSRRPKRLHLSSSPDATLPYPPNDSATSSIPSSPFNIPIMAFPSSLYILHTYVEEASQLSKSKYDYLWQWPVLLGKSLFVSSYH